MIRGAERIPPAPQYSSLGTQDTLPGSFFLGGGSCYYSPARCLLWKTEGVLSSYPYSVKSLTLVKCFDWGSGWKQVFQGAERSILAHTENAHPTVLFGKQGSG
ncbi:UNVERIFIED_CONTAM: hypothetical protein K2H54_036336 [Gekko kuhli]